MTDETILVSSDQLASLGTMHANLARELARLHNETLTMQTKLGDSLNGAGPISTHLLGLQNLDAHAQLLLDLSRVLETLGKNTAQGHFDTTALRSVPTLASTIQALFEPPTRSRSKQDDVTFF